MARRQRIPTGVSALDRNLGGGIPTGSLLTLIAPPKSQAEVFLYTLSARRDTFYITTERSRGAVRNAFGRVPDAPEIPQIEAVDADDPLDNAADLIKQIPEEALVIIDTINILEEADSARYRRFLNQLQTHMINTGGIAVLYGIDGRSTTENRDSTLNMTDIIFSLRTEITENEVINTLSVPKFRGGTALEDTLKLRLRDGVAIDTSRDIA